MCSECLFACLPCSRWVVLVNELLWLCVLNASLLVCHAVGELYWLIALVKSSEFFYAYLSYRMWVVPVSCCSKVFWIPFCLSVMQKVSCTDQLFWFCCLNFFIIESELYQSIASVLCSEVFFTLPHRGWVALLVCSHHVFWILLVCHAAGKLYWLIAFFM